MVPATSSILAWNWPLPVVEIAGTSLDPASLAKTDCRLLTWELTGTEVSRADAAAAAANSERLVIMCLLSSQMAQAWYWQATPRLTERGVGFRFENGGRRRYSRTTRLQPSLWHPDFGTPWPLCQLTVSKLFNRPAACQVKKCSGYDTHVIQFTSKSRIVSFTRSR